MRFNSIKRGKRNSSTNDYQTDYQHDAINTTFFQNSFQKLYRVIKVMVIKVIKDFQRKLKGNE